MNFPQAIVAGFKNYSSGAGRASRSEFWYWSLFCLICNALLPVLDNVIFHVPYSKEPFYTHPISTIFFLITVAPSISVGIRRLHDVNRKSTWYLIGLTLVGLIPLFMWSCMKGTLGDNQFGVDPLKAHASLDVHVRQDIGNVQSAVKENAVLKPGIFSKLSVKAILLGFLAGVIANILFGVMLAFLSGSHNGQDVAWTAPLLTVELIMDVLAWGLGGLVAYNFAKVFPMRNVTLTAIIFLIDCLLLLFVNGGEPLWFVLLDTALIIPSTYSGGLLAKMLVRAVQREV
jgi:uncharacterized membrane protein YhaH (DUF805 family)